MPGQMYMKTRQMHTMIMYGIMPGEDLVQRHVLWRDALEVEGGHRHRRREERGLEVHRDHVPNRMGSMWKWLSSGMKIGQKITMISVHSSGQPSRKISAAP